MFSITLAASFTTFCFSLQFFINAEARTFRNIVVYYRKSFFKHLFNSLYYSKNVFWYLCYCTLFSSERSYSTRIWIKLYYTKIVCPHTQFTIISKFDDPFTFSIQYKPIPHFILVWMSLLNNAFIMLGVSTIIFILQKSFIQIHIMWSHTYSSVILILDRTRSTWSCHVLLGVLDSIWINHLGVLF